MPHESLHVIREEHAALTVMLRSLSRLLERGPQQDAANYFTVLRAIFFCIDEFHEKQHHPKESELLFPGVAAASGVAAEVVLRLEQDHILGEAAVRELQHLLLAWELIGETRREPFESACTRYVALHLDHIALEEDLILPEAERCLSEPAWRRLDEAFASNRGPLEGKYPSDPAYERLFAHILRTTPSQVDTQADS